MGFRPRKFYKIERYLWSSFLKYSFSDSEFFYMYNNGRFVTRKRTKNVQ